MQSIYIRTKSVVLVASLHGLINYLGNYKYHLLLPNLSSNQVDVDLTYTFQDFLSSLVSLFVIILMIVLISYVLIRKELVKESKELENLISVEI